MVLAFSNYKMLYRSMLNSVTIRRSESTFPNTREVPYMETVLFNGLGFTDAALFLNRLLLGLFFFLARFRFFYDPSKPTWYGTNTRIGNQRWFNQERRESLTRKLKLCRFHIGAAFWTWFVAIVEVVGGLMLLVGVFAPAAAMVLLILTVVATCCTARSKVYEQNPVDCADVLSCYLWRVEGLYIAMAAVVILAGPGAFSFAYASASGGAS